MAWQRGRSYSQDLRERVLAADALTSRRAAARFAVSVSYVIKARQRRDRTGALTTKTRGYRRAPRLGGLDEVIVAEVERRPSATLADLREWLASTHGISISTGTMWRTLRQLGLPLKKSGSAPPNRRVRMLPPRATFDAACNGNCTPNAWSFSMRPGPRPI
jgi:transposase